MMWLWRKIKKKRPANNYSYQPWARELLRSLSSLGTGTQLCPLLLWSQMAHASCPLARRKKRLNLFLGSTAISWFLTTPKQGGNLRKRTIASRKWRRSILCRYPWCAGPWIPRLQQGRSYLAQTSRRMADWPSKGTVFGSEYDPSSWLMYQ
jgi:hypothetical protein